MSAAESETVVGKCFSCGALHDTVQFNVVCTVCRDPVLACVACQKALREFHCEAHLHLAACYFTNLQGFSRAELEQQCADLKVCSPGHRELPVMSVHPSAPPSYTRSLQPRSISGPPPSTALTHKQPVRVPSRPPLPAYQVIIRRPMHSTVIVSSTPLHQPREGGLLARGLRGSVIPAAIGRPISGSLSHHPDLSLCRWRASACLPFYRSVSPRAQGEYRA